MSCDIYFDEKYGKLCEKIEGGEAVTWKYCGVEGEVRYVFILRKIPGLLDGQQWYDIISPYGYGGPLIENINAGYSRKELVQKFEESFSCYCAEHHIVSEFVRFHPIVNNAADFGVLYNAQFDRYTVGTNLADYNDPVAEEFSKSCRKSIRQAINKGIEWRVTPGPAHIEDFKEIYYSTMDRNHASEFYYFDDEYFNDCVKYFRENLLLVEAIFEGKTIAAGLYFVSGKTIHVHLSGTLSNYLFLSPAYILKYATAVWGKEKGYSLIHYGGGQSNSPEDSLFQFKKKFGKNTELPFYIGRRIRNSEIYSRLCAEKGADASASFFPAYRAK